MSAPDLRALPKAVLHDHLDGGLRPETVLELADAAGVEPPEADPARLAVWFHQGESGSLERYLAAFDATTAVMQTADSLVRVARECIEDLAADGVIYAEIRFGPSLHQAGGLRREDAIEAVTEGLRVGGAEHGVVTGLIVSALRHQDDSEDVARAAAAMSDAGVVGFDLAGPEQGHPADDHLPAFTIARNAGLGVTIHAGESDGPHSVWRAVVKAGARRVGHGVRIIEDTTVRDGAITAVGGAAALVRDHRIPLEVCILSNIHTGVAPSPATHPLGALHRAGFRLTLNTDNRLMSGTSMTREFELAHLDIGLPVRALGEATVTALEAGFGSWADRERLIREVVEPAYAAADAG